MVSLSQNTTDIHGSLLENDPNKKWNIKLRF